MKKQLLFFAITTILLTTAFFLLIQTNQKEIETTTIETVKSIPKNPSFGLELYLKPKTNLLKLAGEHNKKECCVPCCPTESTEGCTNPITIDGSCYGVYSGDAYYVSQNYWYAESYDGVMISAAEISCGAGEWTAVLEFVGYDSCPPDGCWNAYNPPEIIETKNVGKATKADCGACSGFCPPSTIVFDGSC